MPTPSGYPPARNDRRPQWSSRWWCVSSDGSPARRSGCEIRRLWSGGEGPGSWSTSARPRRATSPADLHVNKNFFTRRSAQWKLKAGLVEEPSRALARSDLPQVTRESRSSVGTSERLVDLERAFTGPPPRRVELAGRSVARAASSSSADGYQGVPPDAIAEERDRAGPHHDDTRDARPHGPPLRD